MLRTRSLQSSVTRAVDLDELREVATIFQGVADCGFVRPESVCCDRLERVGALISGRRPRDSNDCFQYLSDPAVRMQMTVQQMVFRAATGEYWMRDPLDSGAV
jgi:hypothetical protein